MFLMPHSWRSRLADGGSAVPSLPHHVARISQPLHQRRSSEKSLINMGRAEASGSSQKTPQRLKIWMLNEVWMERRGGFTLTTLAKAAVCLCYVVVLNKHCSTRVHTHTYLCTHTEAACSCVLVRSRASLCGLVGFSNTHALCLCCAQRPPVVWASHNLLLPAHQRSP